MTRRLMSTGAATSALKVPIDLLTGWPNPTLLPPGDLQVAAGIVCNDASISTAALVYGPDEGYKPLQEAVASWLTNFYKLDRKITFDQICITGGASQNLACLLQVYTDPIYTRNIWLVSPTYFHACKIFDDGGFSGRMKAVPEDEEGIDIEYLEKGIRASEEAALQAGNASPKLKSPKPYRKFYKHIIYAVPTFSNPSGKLMSLSRREALVRLARKYDALIITDDVYDMLQWPASFDAEHRWSNNSNAPLEHACLPRIVDIDAVLDGGPIDEFGNSVTNGSFSKIVAPGCRTGWAQGTAKMANGVSKAGSTQSGGAPSHFTSTLIHQLLKTNKLQPHIFHTLQPAYSRRYHLILDAMKTHLEPLGCTIISKPARIPSKTQPSSSSPSAGIAGGYFHYFTLPSALKSSTTKANSDSNDNHQNPIQAKEDTIAVRIAAKALREENLRVMAGPLFRVEGDETESSHRRYEADIRLSFAWEDEDLLVKGVERLAAVIQREIELVQQSD